MVVGVSAGEGKVPAALPPILKNYTKAAIRTQPRDLLAWSHAYFKALCEGDSPPVKDQLEFPQPDTPTGITPGLLRVLHKKLNPDTTAEYGKLQELCTAFNINEAVLKKAWNSDDFDEDRPWLPVLAGLVSQTDQSTCEQLTTFMYTVTEELLTKSVPLEDVLAFFDLLPKEDIKDENEVKEFLQDVASYQEGCLYPSDLTRPSCPLT